jgi:hypothetical protein
MVISLVMVSDMLETKSLFKQHSKGTQLLGWCFLLPFLLFVTLALPPTQPDGQLLRMVADYCHSYFPWILSLRESVCPQAGRKANTRRKGSIYLYRTSFWYSREYRPFPMHILSFVDMHLILTNSESRCIFYSEYHILTFPMAGYGLIQYRETWHPIFSLHVNKYWLYTSNLVSEHFVLFCTRHSIYTDKKYKTQHTTISKILLSYRFI